MISLRISQRFNGTAGREPGEESLQELVTAKSWAAAESCAIHQVGVIYIYK